MSTTPLHLTKPAALQQKNICLETVYGTDTITEPVLIDLITSPALQRLKKINQFGITHYIRPSTPYTRYQHSIGVLVLLRKFGAHLNEQIAGLLHDVSHTVFSHVGDLIFPQTSAKDSYQDTIHTWYIQHTELEAILARHGLDVSEILHKDNNFTMLEQDLPNLCADRLEYNLFEGWLEKQITAQEISELLATLRVTDGTWFFTDAQSAKKCALLSLYNTEHHFASPHNMLIYRWAADLLKHALAIELISKDEIHFSYDDAVWHTLSTSTDPKIKKYMHMMQNCEIYFCLASAATNDLHLVGKFRGINPLILKQDTLIHLTELDTSFAQEYMRVKKVVENGTYITLLDS